WLVFFFSSRRRHTRFSRDWSSDVCSSDLLAASTARHFVEYTFGTQVSPWSTPATQSSTKRSSVAVAASSSRNISATWCWTIGLRSEERRVGKEGRGRWGAGHGTKTSVQGG